MAPDRRVAACLLLLVAAIPLLLAQLPQNVEVVAGPLALLLVTSVLMLTPIPRWATVGVWAPTALVLVGCDHWSAPMASWALLTIFPLGLCVLEQRLAWVFVAIGVGPLLLGLVGGWSEMTELRAFSLQHPSDLLGALACAAWVSWQSIEALRFALTRRKVNLQRETAQYLEEAISRDLGWLDSIATMVADPSLKGPVRNPGVGTTQLAMAARIDADVVLLGWIEGPVLATLSVGWGLCAAARAGLRDPRALLTLARHRFDEIVDPTGVRWIAVWDRRRGQITTAGAAHPGPLSRYMLTAHGPTAIGPHVDVDTLRAVRELLDEADATAGVPDAEVMSPMATVYGLGLTAGAVLACALPLPGLMWLACVVLLTSAHGLIMASTRKCDAMAKETEIRLRDRSEAHDDLRFQLARWHGSLLEYRIEIGDFGATAHRLRGEVLNGAFADMLVDASGHGRIFAGEVAGRGIAARFLGLAAQVVVRVLLEQGFGEDSPESMAGLTQQRLRIFGEALRFPVHLRLGMVTCSPRGQCTAWGSLRQLVLVGGPDTVSEPHATIVHEAQLDAHRRVYLTPAAALPGPEDDAPALGQSEACVRVAQILSSSRGRPQADSLASLFSLVFDGVNAPAHGTLIELGPSLRQVHGDDQAKKQHAGAEEESNALSVASS